MKAIRFVLLLLSMAVMVVSSYAAPPPDTKVSYGVVVHMAQDVILTAVSVVEQPEVVLMAAPPFIRTQSIVQVSQSVINDTTRTKIVRRWRWRNNVYDILQQVTYNQLHNKEGSQPRQLLFYSVSSQEENT